MVKLNTAIVGPDFAYSAGDVVNMEKHEKGLEKRLIKSGQAEPVKKTAKKAK